MSEPSRVEGILQSTIDNTEYTQKPLSRVEELLLELKEVIEAGASAEEIAEIEQEINLLTARVDEIASLPEGSTSGDAELIDIRVGADGTTYSSAGNAVRGQVGDLKSNLQYANYETIDQSEKFTSGEYIALNVGIGNTVSTTPVSSVQRGYVILPCKKGDLFLLTATGGSAPRAWGFTDGAYKLLSVSGNGSNASGATLIAEEDGYFISNHDVTKTYSLVATQLKVALNERTGGILAQEKVDDNNEDVLGYEHINLFNRETISAGKYLNPATGNISSNSDWYTSDWIEVTGISPLKIYGTKYVCCYNAAKEFIDSTEEADTYDEAKTQTLPTGTKYIRLSAGNNHLDATQVGKMVYPDRRIDHQQYALKKLLVAEDQIIESPIIVDANGNGDYTSFTLACKENYGNNRDIIVMPGTYDINAEYIAIWGAEAVGSMADADGDIFDGWQYGVKMNGRKYTFYPGAKIVCDWTGHTVDGTHRFSALRVEKNAEIIGLDLDCTGTFYCIHDDYGDNKSVYTNIYRKCRVIGHSISNVNCIGGGCKKYSRHIIENCLFDNNTSASTAVRYHNTNADGAVPEIFVSNSFFGTYFRANYYGAQTSKMRVYVNNCYAKRIYKGAEGSASVDNVELYKWNNTETDPET